MRREEGYIIKASETIKYQVCSYIIPGACTETVFKFDYLLNIRRASLFVDDRLIVLVLGKSDPPIYLPLK